MAKKYTQDDLGVRDLYGAWRESAESFGKTLDATNAKINKQTEAVEKLLAANKKGQKALDANQIARKKLNELSKQAVATDKTRVQLDKQLTAAKQKLAQAQKGENKELLETRERLKRVNAAQRKNIKNTLDSSNAYKDLTNKVNSAQARFKKLAAQYGLTDKRTIKARKSFEKLDDSLRKINNAARDGRRDVGRYGIALNKVRGNASRLAGVLGVGFGLSQAKSFITDSISAFRQQQKSIAQVEAGLKSTGNQAGFTSKQLQEMASSLQKETLFGDEQILQDATAQLLTFTNISGEQFDRTQKAALDLATRLDGDLKSASIQLGKALNDPVANLSALSRSGIQFSDEQKEVIKTMAESGRLAEAQTLILDELNKQYGGSAKAAAEADGGMTQLSNAIGDAKEKFGEIVLEGLKPTIQSLKEFFENLTEEDIRKFVSALGTMFKILGKLIKVFVVFKTTMLALKMAERVREFRSFGGSLKNLTSSLKGASDGAKKMGAALKGIGLSVAITLVMELAQAWWNVASGAANAEKFQKAAARAADVGTSKATEKVEALRKKEKERIDEIRKMNLSREDEIKLIEEAKKATEDQLKADVKRVRENKIAAQQAKEAAKEAREAFLELKGGRATIEALDESVTGVVETISESMGGSVKTAKERLDELDEAVRRTASRERKAAAALEIYRGELESTTNELVELDIETVKLDTSTGKLTESTKEQTKALKELDDWVSQIREKDQEYQAELDDELQQENALIDKRLTERLTKIIDAERLGVITAEEAAEQRLIAEIDSLLARIKIMEIYGEDVTDIENELAQRRLELVKLNGKEVADEDKDALDRRKQMIESFEEYINKILDESLDKAIERSQERQDLIQEEIDASKALEDQLRESAKNGNATAQESLKAQEDITQQKIQDKKDEAKREEILQQLQIWYQSILQYMEGGDDLPKATAKATAGQALIDSTADALFNLAGFWEGTEWKLGQEHDPIFSGRDGHVVRVDSNEGIANAGLMNMAEGAGLNSMEDVFNKAVLFQQLSGSSSIGGMSLEKQAQTSLNTIMLYNELKGLRKDLNNKKEIEIAPEMRNAMMVGMKVIEKKGSKVEIFRYRD